mgnify:CR=1 FL=1
MKNYYDIIGVTSDASSAAIKARYRALSKLRHPDAGGSQEQMIRLNVAYSILSNPLERAVHDRQLARERQTAQANAQAATAARAKQRAQTQQAHDDEFFASATNKAANIPPKRKSAFWQFMAWSTGVYIVIGLAIMYVLTMPSTATSDTTAETTSLSTSLAQEAASASASASSNPILQYTSEDTGSNNTSDQNNTAAASTEVDQAADATSDSDSQAVCDDNKTSTTTCSTAASSQSSKKSINWRQRSSFNN